MSKKPDEYDLKTILKERGLSDEEIYETLHQEIKTGMGTGYKDKENKNMSQEITEKKLRKMLKIYNTEDDEIENFINDLKELADDEDLEEPKSERILTNEVIAELKKTEAGKKILLDAPTYQKEELKKIIADYLQQNK